MAKKKKKTPKPTKKPSRQKRPPRSLDPTPQSPVFGRTLSDVDLDGDDWDADSPLARAQEIVYEAFDADDQRRVKLAQKALTICPDCTDAYVLLAEQADDLDQAIELYDQAIAAGRRVLGENTFRQYEGEFWGILETRPYMRARLGLAHCLRFAGRAKEAAEHFQEMLRLNPGDNQGVRWNLASCLLEFGRHDDLSQLLAKYTEDGTACWAYTKALHEFCRGGDSAKARQLLGKAVRGNEHVPRYLLGDARMPRQIPDFFTPGDDSEAVMYAVDFLPGWKATPGAISWLRKSAKAGPGRAKPSRARVEDTEQLAADPLNSVSSHTIESLLELPQAEDEVWQADVLRAPTWVEIDGEPIRPWLILVTDRSNDLIMAHDMLSQHPPASALWEKLCEAMRSPMGDGRQKGLPHRPGEVQVRSEDHRSAAGAYLDAIGVRCAVCDQLDQLDFVFSTLSEQMFSGESIPALVDVPGVELKQVGGYFEAAADFFHQAPWRNIPGDTPIKVDCDKFDSGPWYAVVMGQSGLTLGFALYDNYQALQSLLSGGCDSDEAHRRASALSITFDEEFTMAIADLEAAEQFGWPVATPEAYPCAMRLNPGNALRPPLAWELELLEGCLRAIPEFLASKETAPQRVTVPVTAGELELVLSWHGKVAPG